MSTSGPTLRDIHLPSAAWWPPALGWWLLTGLIVLAVAVIAWLSWRRVRLRPLRVALREIDVLQAAYVHDGDMASLAAGASRLLRRIARLGDPNAAASAGDIWRSFLCRHAANQDEARILDALMIAPFRSYPELDAQALLVLLPAWCKRALRGSRGFRFGGHFRGPSGGRFLSRSHRGDRSEGGAAAAAANVVSRRRGP